LCDSVNSMCFFFGQDQDSQVIMAYLNSVNLHSVD